MFLFVHLVNNIKSEHCFGLHSPPPPQKKKKKKKKSRYDKFIHSLNKKKKSSTYFD